VAQDAGVAEGAVVVVIILYRVEDNRHTRELAPDGDRRLDAVHLACQLNIHQDGIGCLAQAPGKRIFTA
jgi:hypothetical protein